MHVGQQLVDQLIGYGVVRVFGCPGGQTLPLYNAIARSVPRIEHVLARDERSAVFEADAYARATGTVGVCDATVGPGASNLVSGLVEAYCSSVPVLAIVPDIARSWEHRRHLGSASQGFEQRRFLEGCVKWYGRVETPEMLAEMLRTALRIATGGRPGPVVLEIPEDVFSGEAAEPAVQPDSSIARFPQFRSGPDPEAVRAAAGRLSAAERPMIVAGGGALIADAGEAVLALATRLGCPVATTVTGKGLVPENHALAVGTAGTFGVPAANDLLAEADAVVFIGSKAGQGTTMGWNVPAQETLVVHIDVDPDEIGRNYRNTIGIVADARLGTEALLAALGDTAPGTGLDSGWDLAAIAERQRAWWTGPIEYKQPPVDGVCMPQDVVRAIRDATPGGAPLVTDASLSSGWGATRWQVREPGRKFLAPRGLAGLGWGLPAAVGVALAARDRGAAHKVVCLAGDGGWAYSMAEIETAARFQLPIVTVLLNNSVLGWIKHTAASRYPDEMVSERFLTVDFAAVARGLGAVSGRVSDLKGFAKAFGEAMADPINRPWVIEVTSSEFETPVVRPTARQQGARGQGGSY